MVCVCGCVCGACVCGVCMVVCVWWCACGVHMWCVCACVCACVWVGESPTKHVYNIARHHKYLTMHCVMHGGELILMLDTQPTHMP